MGVPEPKRMHVFSPIYQNMFTREDLELIRVGLFVCLFFFFWGGGGGGGGGDPGTTVDMTTLLRFLGLKVCGCSIA